MWETPQILMACMIAFSAFWGWVLHGKTITINGWPKLVDAMILAIVLYWGGFWHD
jgi:hypothetical protein